VGSVFNNLTDLLHYRVSKMNRESSIVLFDPFLRRLIAIHCAEDQAHRAAIWTGSKLQDHQIFLRLETTHKAIIERVLDTEPQLLQNTADLLAAGDPAVVIVHSCSHFGRAYALNRFLALLLIRVLERMGSSPRINGYRAESILPASGPHLCDGNDPETCYAFPHNVTFRQTTCREPATGASRTQTFDKIVVRGPAQNNADPTKPALSSLPACETGRKWLVTQPR
jgi:hypothetical protein